MDQPHSKFGQYELLGRIATGGMAEVFRGRAIGEEGFEKPVAIKRILPSLARDTRFASMLITEARIHAELSHRNIVQIHDLGISEQGEYFIVLEYVDGPDLSTLLDVLVRTPTTGGSGLRLSDAVALYVATELGEGVHFAHALRGADGQPMNLVHRDISPSNVLLSYAGEVKLSDFGLAKRRTDHSVVGSLKGKLAYMSPEQARRVPLDLRSDIFSLGAVLYEMLTGQRLRNIADDFSGWQQVASGLVPPAKAVRPDIPPVLEAVLTKALAPDPRDRFTDARAFAAATREALEQVPRSASSEAVELQGILKQLIPPGSPRPVSDQSKVIRLVSEFMPSTQPIPGAPAARESRAPSETTAETVIAPMPVRPSGPVATQLPAASRTSPPTPPRLTPSVPVATLAARMTPSQAMPPVAARMTPSQSAPALPPRSTPTNAVPVPVRATPSSAVPAPPPSPAPAPRTTAGLMPVDNSFSSSNPIPAVVSPTATRKKNWIWTPFILVFAGVGAAGFVHFQVMPLSVASVWQAPTSLDIRSQPVGAEAYLDGHLLPGLTPTFTNVKRDRHSHVVEVRKAGFKTVRRSIRFDRSLSLEVVAALENEARPAVEQLPLLDAADAAGARGDTAGTKPSAGSTAPDAGPAAVNMANAKVASQPH